MTKRKVMKKDVKKTVKRTGIKSKMLQTGKKAVNIKISVKRRSGVGKRGKCEIGEGSTLIVSKGKVKVKN